MREWLSLVESKSGNAVSSIEKHLKNRHSEMDVEMENTVLEPRAQRLFSETGNSVTYQKSLSDMATALMTLSRKSESYHFGKSSGNAYRLQI